MKIFSKSDERLSSPLNQHLSTVIPIVYGAVFSYSMYVLSRLLIGMFAIFKKNNDFIVTFPMYSNYLYSLLVFCCVTLFMVQDVGGLFKLAEVFPYRRTSRYTYEIWIASSYVAIFSFIEMGSYFSVILFGMILILCGLWCNQFKEEYSEDDTKIDRLMVTERGIYYFFAAIIMLQASFFILGYREINLNIVSTLVFIITYTAFLCILTFLPYSKHGINYLDYIVNIIFPDYFFKEFEKISLRK